MLATFQVLNNQSGPRLLFWAAQIQNIPITEIFAGQHCPVVSGTHNL